MALSISNARIATIGAGNMAEAIVKGITSKGVVKKDNVMVSDISEARKQLFRDFGVAVTSDNQQLVNWSDIIIICIKPQVVAKVLAGMKEDNSKLFVSICAGTSIATFQKILGQSARIVRVMPNTPMLCGEGACGIVGGPNVKEGDVEAVVDLFSLVAKEVIVVDEEDQINAVTAVSGSGPAYVFRLIEGMTEGGVKSGLSREQAQKLAIQTVIGAGKLAQQSDVSPAELRKRVTSPNGTTQAALEYFASKNWFDITRDGTIAATNRGRELSKL